MRRLFPLIVIAALMIAELSYAQDVTTRLEISGDILILSYSDSRDSVIFRRDSESGYNVPPMKIDIPGTWTLDDKPTPNVVLTFPMRPSSSDSLAPKLHRLTTPHKPQSHDIPHPKPKPKSRIRISSSSIKQAFTGEEYTFALKASGADKVTWSCDSLPQGLSLNPETGIISGVPVSDFKGKINVTAMNDEGKISRLLQFGVKTRKPVILTSTLPGAFVSEDYRVELSAGGGKGITWSFRGKIPDGLSLSQNGVINGVPEKAGRFTFSATAENSGGKATRRFTLRVSENTPHEYVTAAVMPAITVSEDGTYEFALSIDATVPEGSFMEWHSFPYGMEAEDEIYTFKDSRGKDTITVPKNHSVILKAFLEAGVRYEPVITARVKTQKPKLEQPVKYSGCNMSGIASMILLIQIIRKRGNKS